jgi:enoyl-CoA hydratase/carnithine racemase
MRPDEFTRMRLSAELGVATITLNRPERRNAWAGRTAVEYRWALHWCHVDPEVRAVVVTGENDFCVGADSAALDDIGDGGGAYEVDRVELPDFPAETPQHLRRNHFYPLAISVPVIAAISGACAGAGFVVASYADMRFADRQAKVATAFAGLGLPAEYGLGWLLPRIVGFANAAQLLYSPRPITAARAADLGWVQRVCEPGEVVADAVAYARGLASGSSAESLRMMKRQLFIDSALGFDDAYRASVRDMNTALGSADFRKGVRALRAKTPPDFLAARPPADEA